MATSDTPAPNTTTLREWEVQRGMQECLELFPLDKRVRHLNPELSSWRGTVVPASEVPRHSWHLRERKSGRIDVRVKWSKGISDVGWYSAGMIAPDDAGPPPDQDAPRSGTSPT